MKLLDPVIRQCFPTLARYARKMKWAVCLAVAAFIYTVGFHNGLLVGSYRGQVADESYTHMVREFNQFKEEYLKHHAKSLTVTKAQASDSAWRKEKERP